MSDMPLQSLKCKTSQAQLYDGPTRMQETKQAYMSREYRHYLRGNYDDTLSMVCKKLMDKYHINDRLDTYIRTLQKNGSYAEIKQKHEKTKKLTYGVKNENNYSLNDISKRYKMTRGTYKFVNDKNYNSQLDKAQLQQSPQKMKSTQNSIEEYYVE